MDLNTFEYLCKTENKARLYFKKYCWENSHVFFSQRVEATKSIEFLIKGIVVRPVDISFMTLPADGLIRLKYRQKMALDHKTL